MHEVLRSKPVKEKSVVRLTDRPDMTLDVYRGRKTMQCNNGLFHCYKLDESICHLGVSSLFRRLYSIFD